MTPMLSDRQYERFRDLLHNRSGLFYPEHKRTDLAHRLFMVLRDTSYPALDALYADAVNNGPAWDLLVNNLTIGETYFFRNTPQFDALRQHILPELIARRADLPPALRSLRLWSAGCSTGEEPYSLAMVLRGVLPDVEQWYVSILATDINSASLARAREAVYKEWSFRETSVGQRAEFFEQDGKHWRVRPDIRSMVTFARLNLVENTYPSIINSTSALDLIVCRNVTIYFNEETTRQIIDRMYQALTPGGWLIVGHAEPNGAIYHQFETHNFPNTVVYRKSPSMPVFAVAQGQTQPVLVPAPALVQPQAQPISVLAPAPRVDHFADVPRARPRPATPAACPSATSRWNAFKITLKHGDADTAGALLDMLLAEVPNDVQALCACARLELERGNMERAHSAVAQALKHDALCVEAHFVLAQLHEQGGEHEQAIAAYRRAVFLDANCVPGMLGMATAWKALGQAANAQRCYHNALKQLALMPAHSKVPLTDGVTVNQLSARVSAQIE